MHSSPADRHHNIPTKPLAFVRNDYNVHVVYNVVILNIQHSLDERFCKMCTCI